MEGDITLGLTYVGAGLATLGMIGAAIGVGHIFGSFHDAAVRNPSAAPHQTGNLFIGMALSEALGILSFLVAILILYIENILAIQSPEVARNTPGGHRSEKRRSGRTRGGWTIPPILPLISP